GSVVASEPLMLTAEPYTGEGFRSSTELPAAPTTVVAGVKVEPLAVQLLAMVIKALLMLKKMLPRAFTITRPTDVGRLGIVMVCVPSLGVLAASVSGNVTPPSVESK